MKRLIMLPLLLLPVLMAQTTTPATKPTTQAAVHPVVRLLDSMPKNLWPTADETKVKSDARSAWLKEHFVGKQGPWAFEGTVTEVSTRTVSIGVGPGRTKAEKRPVVKLSVDRLTAWGGAKTVSIRAVMNDTTLEKAVDWKPGMKMTLTGSVTISLTGSASARTADIELMMEHGPLKATP